MIEGDYLGAAKALGELALENPFTGKAKKAGKTAKEFAKSNKAAKKAQEAGRKIRKEHDTTKSASTKGKHQEGQARKKRDRGGEKGDKRRPY
jgi:hypothetical protein